jgi:translation initiation factor 3 subunit I
MSVFLPYRLFNFPGMIQWSAMILQVLVGGGQEAMQVTTTDIRQGKFEARFFHLVFEEEFARVKGHFGPINSVAFHPDGTR